MESLFLRDAGIYLHGVEPQTNIIILTTAETSDLTQCIQRLITASFLKIASYDTLVQK
jgi:hypothetical protein